MLGKYVIFIRIKKHPYDYAHRDRDGEICVVPIP